MRRVKLPGLVFLVGLAACSSEPVESEEPEGCEPGTAELTDGSCVEAGLPAGACGEGFEAGSSGDCEPVLPPEACPPGTMGRLGSTECQPVGVPADGCAGGFTSDGEGGCDPVLPAAPCTTGTMAVPGETTCLEPMPCGAGPWGDIPLDAATQFVDRAYDPVPSGASDGTQEHPWTTIQAGIDAAAAGAVVAVTDGSYPENLVIQDHAVHLWGRCPTAVEIVGTAGAQSTLEIAGASGSEVHGVALTGSAKIGAVGVYGATDVVVDRVWIHDHGSRGVYAEPLDGEASLTLSHSLLERVRDLGVFIDLGAEATIERSVIRDVQPRANKTFGRALVAQGDPSSGKRSAVHVSGSLLERTHDIAVFIVASDATLEGTVVRDTQPQVSDLARGWGFAVQTDPTTLQKGTLRLDGCWVGNHHDLGFLVSGSSATIKRTVIRDTLSHQPDLLYGHAIELIASSYDGEGGVLTVEDSLIAGNRTLAVSITGSDATFERTIVRGTLPQEADMTGGRGLEAGYNHDNHQPSSLTVQDCLLEDNREVGLFVWGSTATVENTTIRGTLASVASASAGRGVEIQTEADHDTDAKVDLVRVIVEGNREAGIFATGAEVVLDSSLVRGTLPDEATGRHGYGVVGVSDGKTRGHLRVYRSLLDGNHDASLLVVGSDAEIVESSVRGTLASPKGGLGDGAVTLQNGGLQIVRSHVRDNARAGAAAFGGGLTLEGSWLTCNEMDLVSEAAAAGTPGGVSFEPMMTDAGDNACGCEEKTPCKAASPGLAHVAVPVLPALATAH